MMKLALYRKWLGVLFMLALTLAAANQTALAQGPVGGTVPTGAIVDTDIFLMDPNIIIDGTVNGDVFAIGQNVTINGNVDGSVFLIADRATLRGKTSGSVFSIATALNIEPSAALDRSLYALAVSLYTGQGSTIARNLDTLAFGARLAGNVGGETRAVIGPLEILRALFTRLEALQLFSQSMNLPRLSPQTAQLDTAPSCRGPIGTIGGIVLSLLSVEADCAPPLAQTQPTQNNLQDIAQWGLRRVRDFVTLFIVGALFLLLAPKRMEAWRAPVGTNPLLSAALGLLIAINGVLLAIVLTMGVALLGFAFNLLGLSSLALLTWGLGLALVGAAFWIFILMLLFVSQAIVAYWGGAWLLNRFAPQVNRHRLIPFAVGLVLLVLLSALPIVGAIVTVAAVLIGAGAVLVSWRDRLPLLGKRKTAAPALATA